jgi:hypothetical protein
VRPKAPPADPPRSFYRDQRWQRSRAGAATGGFAALFDGQKKIRPPTDGLPREEPPPDPAMAWQVPKLCQIFSNHLFSSLTIFINLEFILCQDGFLCTISSILSQPSQSASRLADSPRLDSSTYSFSQAAASPADLISMSDPHRRGSGLAIFPVSSERINCFLPEMHQM